MNDYAGARCCLQNRLLAGLIHAAEAVEKLLKAHILSLAPDTDVRRLSHSLEKLARRALDVDSRLNLDDYAAVLSQLERHYNTRYPDNTNQSQIMSSQELAEIDRVYAYVESSWRSDTDVLCKTGITGLLFVAEQRRISELDVPMAHWCKRENAPLAAWGAQIRPVWYAVRGQTPPGADLDPLPNER